MAKFTGPMDFVSGLYPRRGDTLLMVAVRQRSLIGCTDLLEGGESLQDRDGYGFTVWDRLDPHYGTPLYTLFLQYGADVNQYNPDGLTALHYACGWDHRAVITLLLAQGADPRLPLLNGYHPEKNAYDLGTFWDTPEGRRARLRWDTISIQEVFILASELGLVPIPSYLW